jgi:peptidoglycan/LPS O-acetylase OafA/YrhL
MRGVPSPARFIPEGLLHLLERPVGQVPILDALRALAVTLVICDHTFAWWRDLTGRDLAIGKLPMFYYGWTGVDLFFILSGYLIGRQIWRESVQTGTVQVTRFIIRRGLRIWPLYFFFAIVAPLYRGTPPQVSDWLFFSNYVHGAVEGGWSLSTEEQFYILFPIVVVIALYMKFPSKSLLGLILLIIGVVQLSRWHTATYLLSLNVPKEDIKQGLLYSAGHLRCESLLVGVLLALIETLWPKGLIPLRSFAGGLAGFGLIVGGILAAIAVRTINPLIFWTLSLSIFYGTVTLSLILLRDTWIVRNRLVQSRGVYQISRLSFGMYLWQFFVIKSLLKYAGPSLILVFGNGHFAFLIALLFGMSAAAFASAITFIIIEQPFLEMRERLFVLNVKDRIAPTRERVGANAGSS